MGLPEQRTVPVRLGWAILPRTFAEPMDRFFRFTGVLQIKQEEIRRNTGRGLI